VEKVSVFLILLVEVNVSFVYTPLNGIEKDRAILACLLPQGTQERRLACAVINVHVDNLVDCLTDRVQGFGDQ
jgi:hypothetical protein